MDNGNAVFCMLVGLMLYYLGVLHVGVESSHVVHKDLQMEQTLGPSIVSEDTRTGYHFQPHKNWINGESSLDYISILLFLLIFVIWALGQQSHFHEKTNVSCGHARMQGLSENWLLHSPVTNSIAIKSI